MGIMHNTPALQAFNAVGDLLGSQFVVLSVKSNPAKKTHKAEILLENGLSCTVKFRIHGSVTVATSSIIELQRRSGDCIAFNEVLRKSRDVLNGMFSRSMCKPRMTNATDI